MKEYEFKKDGKVITGNLCDIIFEYCERKGREIPEWTFDFDDLSEEEIKELFLDEMNSIGSYELIEILDYRNKENVTPFIYEDFDNFVAVDEYGAFDEELNDELQDYKNDENYELLKRKDNDFIYSLFFDFKKKYNIRKIDSLN